MPEIEGDGLAGDKHESEPAIGEYTPALQHGKEIRDVERKLCRRFGQELVDCRADHSLPRVQITELSAGRAWWKS